MNAFSRLLVAALIAYVAPAVAAQTGWRVFEETAISGTISGTVQQGYVFRTVSDNLYEVAEPIIKVVVAVMPGVTVLRNGDRYRLIIEGIDDPIMCRRLTGEPPPRNATPEVVESRLSGAFSGFTGDTVLRLQNGQIWEQTEYYYYYHYAYAPEVLIYRSRGGAYRARVDGVDRAVGVRRLR